MGKQEQWVQTRRDDKDTIVHRRSGREFTKASDTLRGVRSPHTHLAQVGATDGGVAGRQHRKPDSFDKEFMNEHGVQIIAEFITLRILFVRVENFGRNSLLEINWTRGHRYEDRS